MHAWVEQNDSSTWTNVLLTCANINRFVILPSRAHIFGRQFLGAPSLPHGQKRSSSSAAGNRKGKKARHELPPIRAKVNPTDKSSSTKEGPPLSSSALGEGNLYPPQPFLVDSLETIMV